MNDIKRGDPAKIESAVTTLDLSDVNSMVRAERGEDLAWMLLEVLDRTRIIVLEDIPESATGNPYVVANYENGMVKISRLGDGRWLFD
ncbi:MAG: mechanosensitive ion channel family protein, partial [Gammaproteobacteria bacterium]|nr:mechanosensitive ion channel family protein [Gammaproteobacteria bacterium]